MVDPEPGVLVDYLLSLDRPQQEWLVAYVTDVAHEQGRCFVENHEACSRCRSLGSVASCADCAPGPAGRRLLALPVRLTTEETGPVDPALIAEAPADRLMYFLITAAPPSAFGADFISQACYERAAALMAERMVQEGIRFAPAEAPTCC